MSQIVILYVLVLGLVASVPMLLDMALAYYSKNKTRSLLIGKLGSSGSLPPELTAELTKAPAGIHGLARATMALTVIVVLGIAIIHMVVQKPPEQDSKIIENVLSILAGLLSAITGFYFGGRSAEQAAATAGAPGAKTP